MLRFYESTKISNEIYPWGGKQRLNGAVISSLTISNQMSLEARWPCPIYQPCTVTSTVSTFSSKELSMRSHAFLVLHPLVSKSG